MVKAIAILTDFNGKTVGAQFDCDGEIKNLTTEQLKAYSGIKIVNAIIDKNGFIRAKNGNIPKINVRPNAQQQLDMVKASKLVNKPIILYHGNKDKDMIPKYNEGKINNDYGRGLYTTQDIELAKEWAWSSYTKGDKGYLHTYEIDTQGLNILDLTKYDSLHWIAELLCNRGVNIEDKEALQDRIDDFIHKYKLDTSSYDIIIGYRADDSYFTYAESFVGGSIYRETIDNALRVGNLGLQVCIKSKKAFSKLRRIKDAEEVPSIYRSRYRKRDSLAREEYREALKNKQRARIKQTIIDFI